MTTLVPFMLLLVLLYFSVFSSSSLTFHALHYTTITFSIIIIMMMKRVQLQQHVLRALRRVESSRVCNFGRVQQNRLFIFYYPKPCTSRVELSAVCSSKQ